MRVLLGLVGVAGLIFVARSMRFEPIMAEPMSVVAAWAACGLCLVSSVWFARISGAAWCGLLAAAAVAANPIAPISPPAGTQHWIDIACAVFCGACVIREWE
ncbi:MAG: hypothetical protein FGM37_09170 [Phycisphaerales bacterium]|nr:hypothetical protein [Phycisphaerales bacterium]